MGFKLSSLFFVDEDPKNDAKKGVEIEKNKVTKEQNIEDLSVKVEKKPEAAGGKTDQDVAAMAKEALVKAMENSNLDGYDYFEFKNSLKALESVIADESVRYKSAFAAAQPMGITSDKLITTAQHYIEVLKSEEKKFLYALGLKSDSDITSSEKRIVQIDAEIKSKLDEIEKIKIEIEKLKNDKKVIIDSIDENKAKIEISKNSFYTVYKEIIEGIESDIKKLSAYIK